MIAPGPDCTRKPVLIVEDDTDAAEALKDYLAPQGFQAHLAHNLLEAEQSLSSTGAGVVLLDVRLGTEFGLDLIPRLRERYPDVLFIVMTAFAATDVAIEALKRGAHDFLRKPFDPAILVTTLDRTFELLRARRERAAAVRELERNEANMRLAQRMSGFGSWEYDVAGNNLFWSQEVYRIFGVQPESFVPTREAFVEFIHPTDRERFVAGYSPTEDAAAADSKDYKIVRNDGELRTVRAMAMLGRNAEGQVERWYGVVQDVTEQLRLEERLRQTQKIEAMGQLASGVAHDFNNVLQIIGGYTELALLRMADGETLRESLQTVLKVTEGAGAVTRRLLAFSRRETMRRQPIDVNEYMANLVRMIRRLISEEIEIRLVQGPGVAPIEADPGLLDQVMVNLCLNARDAMPGGGRLHLETADFLATPDFCVAQGWDQPGRYVAISVADNGTGIAQKVQRRIFEPFFTTKEVGKGSGLGLAVAFGIIQQHRGSITVESEPGKGSTFSVFLPATLEAPAPNDEDTAPVTGASETILVAEDQPAVMALVTSLLRGQGYTVLPATDGAEAVELYRAQRDRVALVMLDVYMPKLNGQKVYEAIRAMDSDVPVIFPPGVTREELNRRCCNRPACYSCKNPIRPGYSFGSCAQRWGRISDPTAHPARGAPMPPPCPVREPKRSRASKRSLAPSGLRTAPSPPGP